MGQEVEVEILKIDQDHLSAVGSIKRCAPDALTDFGDSHQAGQLVLGEVTSLGSQGASVIVAGLPARIAISQIATRWIAHPSEELRCGDEVWAVYLGVNGSRKDRHLKLSLTDVQVDSPLAPEFAHLAEV